MKFDFVTDSVSLLKAETEDYYEIEGLASTSDTDLQDEIIEQDGMDFTEIEYINADHGHEYKDKPGGVALARMGLIDSARMTKKGLWIKGKIFKNHPEAMIYKNELEYGKPGLVQFSIEGNVMARDPFQKNRVRRCKVKGVALTRSAVNPNTFAKLVKSLSADEQIEQKVETAPATHSVDPQVLKDQFNHLSDRYDALRMGHDHLLQENKDLKKAQFLSDKEKVKQLIKARVAKDPEFAKQLSEVVRKALSPGGAQYTKTPGEITGGGVFMTEDLGDDKKKKKKKDKDDMKVVTSK